MAGFLPMRPLLLGAAAGAAGTTALNAVTYLDMAARGRPASSTPEQVVEQMLGKAGVEIPGEGEAQDNRRTALGALSGIATGVSVGCAYGVLRSVGVRPPLSVAGPLLGLAAMAGVDVPIVRLGLTDPRTWGPVDWASDVVPHLAYGLVCAATYHAGEPRHRRR